MAQDPVRRGTLAAQEAAERPQVEMQLDRSFAIGKYEVTFAEWGDCVEAGGAAIGRMTKAGVVASARSSM
jgi:formylglycine-generating enzyme required for sulfatase activity